MHTLSDVALLDQLRSGNAQGLSQLYVRYHDRLLRYCTGLLKEKQASEDVVQNVFLKLQASQSTIRNGQTLQSWLFTVARNEAFNELGKKKPVELCDDVVWDGGSPEDVMLVSERKAYIDGVLARLHLPYREVILLRVYEQLSYDDIAAVTGTTVSSVKSRLFKARKALVHQLHSIL